MVSSTSPTRPVKREPWSTTTSAPRSPDPYRWMEDLDSKAVADWVKAENAVTVRVSRQAAAARRSEEAHHRAVGLPEGRHAVHRRRANLLSQELRPAAAVAALRPHLARRIADSRDRSESAVAGRQHVAGGHGPVAGRDAARLHDLGGRRRLADGARPRSLDGPGSAPTWSGGCASPDSSWTKDAKGFFYSRYPEPPAGKVLEAALSGQALYYHRVGTPQSEDRLIYERKDLPTWFIGGDVTEDGRYLLVTHRPGLRQQEPSLRRRSRRPDAPQRRGAGHAGRRERRCRVRADRERRAASLFLRTDSDAPNRTVIAIDLSKPRRERVEDDRARSAAGDRSRRCSSAAASSPSISSTCRAG